MIDFLLLGVAFAGSLLAGIIDLKTTEVPDWIPYAMGTIGILANITKSILSGSYIPIAYSAAVGLGYLGFGFLLYYLGQWGGGDAKILSAIGFLIPTFSTGKIFFPFYIGFLFNVFFVGAIYMIAYILVLSFINRGIWKSFFKGMAGIRKPAILYSGLAVLLAAALFVYLSAFRFGLFPVDFAVKFSLFVLLIVSGMFLLWRFAKTVEDVGFKKRIPLAKLKEGDVILESKIWEGLTKKQVDEIKKSGKRYVWIKEGVRFTMAFPLALLFTILVGEGFVWLLKLVG
ncbi:hypothetical protein A3K63_05700 [Candidatus Micrarchaeota archaeon RBG_16_49_10]|nr:MAG: hypothetical protein A3K63_05700 [Candidatus Micrarchaeota archaeon RBG_16_49_10]